MVWTNFKKKKFIVLCIIIVIVVYFYQELPEILVNAVNLDSIPSQKDLDLFDDESTIVEDKVEIEEVDLGSGTEETVNEVFNFNDPRYTTLHHIIDMRQSQSLQNQPIVVAPEHLWNKMQVINATGKVVRPEFFDVVEDIVKKQDLDSVERVQVYSASFGLAELKYNETGVWMAPSPAEYFRVMVRDIPDSAMSADEKFRIYGDLVRVTVEQDQFSEANLDNEMIGYIMIALMIIGNVAYHFFW